MRRGRRLLGLRKGRGIERRAIVQASKVESFTLSGPLSSLES